MGCVRLKEGLRGVWGCLGLKSLGGLGVKRQEEMESLQGKLPRATREKKFGFG